MIKIATNQIHCCVCKLIESTECGHELYDVEADPCVQDHVGRQEEMCTENLNVFDLFITLSWVASYVSLDSLGLSDPWLLLRDLQKWMPFGRSEYIYPFIFCFDLVDFDKVVAITVFRLRNLKLLKKTVLGEIWTFFSLIGIKHQEIRHDVYIEEYLIEKVVDLRIWFTVWISFAVALHYFNWKANSIFIFEGIL